MQAQGHQSLFKQIKAQEMKKDADKSHIIRNTFELFQLNSTYFGFTLNINVIKNQQKSKAACRDLVRANIIIVLKLLLVLNLMIVTTNQNISLKISRIFRYHFYVFYNINSLITVATRYYTLMTSNSIQGFLTSLDLFGYPLTLRYKQQATFKTPQGGCVSLFTVVAVVAYFASLLLQMMAGQGSITVSGEYLADASQQLKLTKDNFEIAIGLSYLGEREDVQAQIEDYIMVQLRQVQFGTTNNKTLIKAQGGIQTFNNTNKSMTLCKETAFQGLMGGYYNYGSNISTLLCSQEDFNFILSGGSGNLNATILEATVNYCEQTILDLRYPKAGRKCKNHTEANIIMAKLQIQVLILKQYFDSEELSANPIKPLIYDDLQISLAQNTSQRFNFKLSQNQASLHSILLI